MEVLPGQKNEPRKELVRRRNQMIARAV